MQYNVEDARRLRDRDDWPEVVAHFGLVGFRRDEIVEVVGGQGEDLGGVDIEEHTIGGEEDKVWGNGQESSTRVKGGRDRDDGIARDMVLGKAVGELWGSMGRLVRTLEIRGRKLVGSASE